MINKFLIESFANKIREEEIKKSRFYSKYEYSKKLVESVKDSTGLDPDTIASFLEKRKEKIKIVFDFEVTPASELMCYKIEKLNFILKGFDFEDSSNTAIRNKVIKRHNSQYLNLLFESGLGIFLEGNNNLEELLGKKASFSVDLRDFDDEGFSDLSNRASDLKELMAYHLTLDQEIIDAVIHDIQARKEERYITEFGEYNFMLSSRTIQSLLKYNASKDIKTKRVRQLKTLKQKANKFKIKISKIEGSKFTDMNLKDLLTTTKKRDVYRASIHAPILSNINLFIKG